MGLLPDGDTSENVPRGSPAGEKTGKQSVPVLEPTWTRRALLKTPTFWLLALCMGIDSLALQGLNISLAPYIQDLGYADATLAAVMTFRAIIMVVALPLVGFVAEHSGQARWRVMPFIVQAIGSVILIMAAQPALLWLAVGVYGLGVATMGVMIEVVWADYFGRPSLGLVRSTAFIVAFGFGATGPVAMSAVFDLLGSYNPAFIALAGLFLVAALLMVTLRPPHRLR
jgi:MFS family permease